MNAPVLLLSVSSAPAFGVAAALKHAGATDMPHLQHLTVAGIGRSARATLHHRLRWAGSAVDVIAVSLHILALKLGAPAVVQPVLVMVLLFGLVIRSVAPAGCRHGS
ncbi:MAG: hypothetical protein WCG47_20750 [Dermatophilaceae bacterium]